MQKNLYENFISMKILFINLLKGNAFYKKKHI